MSLLGTILVVVVLTFFDEATSLDLAPPLCERLVRIPCESLTLFDFALRFVLLADFLQSARSNREKRRMQTKERRIL